MTFTSALNLNNQNTGLQLQFILSELIKSYREVVTIDKLSDEISTKIILALKFSVTKLAGSQKREMCFFSLNQEDGLLSRLKNYCAYFPIQNEKSNPSIFKMCMAVNLAFVNSIKSLDLIVLLEKLNPSDQHLQTLHRTLKTMISQIRRFSKLTVDLLHQFSNDENVIFFVLRHKTDLDLLYGSQFVLKLMRKMYPEGLEEASRFLLNRYKNRGFDHLLPLITKKFQELKK